MTGPTAGGRPERSSPPDRRSVHEVRERHIREASTPHIRPPQNAEASSHGPSCWGVGGSADKPAFERSDAGAATRSKGDSAQPETIEEGKGRSRRAGESSGWATGP